MNDETTDTPVAASETAAIPKTDIKQTPFEKHGQVYVETKNPADPRMYNQYHQPVILRGMNTHSMHWDTVSWMDGIMDEAYNAFAYDWEMDVIRLAMYVGEGGYASKPKEVLERLENHIQTATRYGLYVMVDWHVHQPGDPTAPTYMNAGLDAEGMPKAFLEIKNNNSSWNGAQVFFAYIAEKYGHQGNILYEPANEPNPNGSEGMPNSQKAWDDTLVPYFDGVISAIRQYDPAGIVILGSPNWTQNPQYAVSNPVADPANPENPQIMYSIHFYTGTHSYRNFINNIKKTRDAGLPVFATEWGVSLASGNGGPFLFKPATGSTRGAEIWLDELEKMGVGWAAWSLGRKNETSAAFFGVSSLKPVEGENGVYRFNEQDMQEAGHYYRYRLKKAHDPGFVME